MTPIPGYKCIVAEQGIARHCRICNDGTQGNLSAGAVRLNHQMQKVEAICGHFFHTLCLTRRLLNPTINKVCPVCLIDLRDTDPLFCDDDQFVPESDYDFESSHTPEEDDLVPHSKVRHISNDQIVPQLFQVQQ